MLITCRPEFASFVYWTHGESKLILLGQQADEGFYMNAQFIASLKEQFCLEIKIYSKDAKKGK